MNNVKASNDYLVVSNFDKLPTPTVVIKAKDHHEAKKMQGDMISNGAVESRIVKSTYKIDELLKLQKGVKFL